jgi:hypothetical protein
MFNNRGAESFQSEYQRLVESLLRRFTDLEENAEREKHTTQNSSSPEIAEILVREKSPSRIIKETYFMTENRVNATFLPNRCRSWSQHLLPIEAKS